MKEKQDLCGGSDDKEEGRQQKPTYYFMTKHGVMGRFPISHLSVQFHSTPNGICKYTIWTMPWMMITPPFLFSSIM